MGFETSWTLRENLYTANWQWIVIDTKVYDLTKFKDIHPGGAGVLLHPDIGTYHGPTLRLSVASYFDPSQPDRMQPRLFMVSISKKSSADPSTSD